MARASLLAAGLAAAVFGLSTPAYATTTPVTGLAATPADRQVTLRWANPTDPDFAGVTVVVKAGSVPPATPADGTAVEAGTARSRVVTGLANGTAYSFGVFAHDGSGGYADPATVAGVSPVPPVLSSLVATLAPRLLTYGQQAVVTATLRRADTDQPLSGEPLDFYRKLAGQSAFVRIGRRATNAAGVVTHAFLPGANQQWYVAHPVTPYFADSKSATLASTVRPKLHGAVSRYVVEQGQPSVVTVDVAPNHAGQLVTLQLRTSDGWKSISSHQLSAASRTAFAIVGTALGTRTFRLVKSADADHAATVTTAFGVTVVRRTLRAGLSGSDVTDVQRRLAALHYDVPAANGYFGFDTVHATATFQKVQRLPVTGVVDPSTYAHLLHPTPPRLMHPQSGSWIEIDLTRQVLYYGRDGHVLRMLDVSSGSGRLFTVEGETQRAVTPTGSFRVLHKIDGLRVSRLGELWRPAYFASGGFAIHGNGSVPFVPASHGCVRITVAGMNRLFSMLTVGMHVYVYRT